MSHIIDAHMHIWDLNFGEYEWLKHPDKKFEALIGDYAKFRKSFAIPDFLPSFRKNNVTKSIYIQVDGIGCEPHEETAWVQKNADHYGYPHGIIGYADLTDPHVETVLKKHMHYPNFRGIRMILAHDEQHPLLSMVPDYLNDPRLLKGLSLLGKYNLVFDMLIFDHQIDQARKIINKFPDNRIVLEHLCWPLDTSDQGFTKWKERLQHLAECPSVFMKLSAGFCFIRPIEKVAHYLAAALEIFGPDRCIFGSNFPVDSIGTKYDDLIATHKKITQHLSDEDRQKVFCDNAQRIYRV